MQQSYMREIQLLLTQVKMEYDKISPSTTFFLLEVKAFSVMQFPGARIFFDFKGLEGIGCCLQRREARISNLITYELLEAKLKVMNAVG